MRKVQSPNSVKFGNSGGWTALTESVIAHFAEIEPYPRRINISLLKVKARKSVQQWPKRAAHILMLKIPTSDYAKVVINLDVSTIEQQ